MESDLSPELNLVDIVPGARENVGQLEQLINYQFVDKNKAVCALTTVGTFLTTFPREDARPYTKTSQRMEYGGDSILKVLVASGLSHQYPKENAGDLTQKLAQLVSSNSLVQLSRQIGLDRCMIISDFETANTVTAENALADMVEKIVYAIYEDTLPQVDNSMDKALATVQEKFVDRFILPIEQQLKQAQQRNYLGEMNEYLFHHDIPNPEYKYSKTEDDNWMVELYISGINEPFIGYGHNQKIAKRLAAQKVMEHYTPNDDQKSDN